MKHQSIGYAGSVLAIQRLARCHFMRQGYGRNSLDTLKRRFLNAT